MNKNVKQLSRSDIEHLGMKMLSELYFEIIYTIN